MRELEMPHDVIKAIKTRLYLYALGLALGGGAIGPLVIAAAIAYMTSVLSYYHNNTWHCILVVSDACLRVRRKGRWWEGDTYVVEGVQPLDTWDFQDGTGVHHPALDWEKRPFKARSRLEVVVVVDNNSKDEAVRRSATAIRPRGDQYVVGGSRRYNCCDWVAHVFRHAGVNGWSNPNPEPFGPQTAPAWIPSGLIGRAIDALL